MLSEVQIGLADEHLPVQTSYFSTEIPPCSPSKAISPNFAKRTKQPLVQPQRTLTLSRL